MAKIYSFKQLQDETLGWLDEVDNNATTRDNVKAALNAAHVDLLTKQDWNFMLWPTPLTFTTVSGTQQYSLHSEFYKPHYFFNRTNKAYMVETNNRQIGPSGVRWNTDQGPAGKFILRGYSPVAAQPAAAAVVTIVSSSASDSSAKNVTIQGTDSTGTYRVSETINLNGTTPASGSVTFSNPILGVSISEELVGTLTITCGATTILTLQPGEVGRSYPQLFLLNNPTVQSVVEYNFYRQPSDLVNDGDVPDIPPPYQQILVWEALISMATYNTDINTTHVRLWTEKRDALFNALATHDEGNSLDAEPRFVRSYDNDDDGYLPRIYR